MKYRLEVLRVREMKVTRNGSKAVGEGMCMFSGVQEGRVKEGVTIFPSKKMSKCLKE